MNLDLYEKAWKEGFSAGVTRDQSLCPYAKHSADSHSWHSGFIEGMAIRIRTSPAHDAMNHPCVFPTLPDLLDYVEQHAANIYIRTEVNQVSGNYALTELPAAQAIHWFAQFIRNGRVPHRIVTEDEDA